MSNALETILPGFTPSELQQAAIDQIAEYKKELAQYGMYVRTAMELEFMVQDDKGMLTPGTIDLEKAHTFLSEQEQLPFIEKVDTEGEVARGMQMPSMAFQYEVNVADDGIASPKTLAPEKVAAVVEKLKARSLKNMLMDTTCLTTDAIMRDTLLSPSFEARPHANEPKDSILHNEETSALHINISLCDKKGRNLFALSDKLLDHCVRSLVALQNDAALPMLPSEDSLKRINANRSAPAAIGVKTGKYFQGSRHTSVTVRRYMLEGDPYTPAAEQTRIENRLPGADADPFVNMAITMAAMVDAVRQHVHKVEDKANGKINLRIDPTPVGAYPKHDLPAKHSDLVDKFSATSRIRELLGGKLYDAILAEYANEQAITR